MELLRLNRTTYIPDENIEGYSSLIWTERYTTPGDFELKTTLIEDTKKLLPEMSLVTLRNTREVMFVETHSIAVNDDGYPEMTIKGRSVDAFTEHRFLEGAWPKKRYKMAREYHMGEAAMVVLWNVLVNPSVNDVTRAGPWLRSVNEVIPNVVISNSITSTLARGRRWLEPGQAYPEILRYLSTSKLGIRGIRPDSGPAKILSVTTDDKGILSYTDVASTDKLRFDVYSSTDRRTTQSINKRVVFSSSAGHIDTPNYLNSIENFKTMAFVISKAGRIAVFRDTDVEKLYKGWDRRGIWVDGGEPGDDESPAEFLADLPDVGLSELEQHERIKLVEGQISSVAPYVYGKDYALGDLVTFSAGYDFKQHMQVVEYVRTEDADGDRGYPGLVVTL